MSGRRRMKAKKAKEAPAPKAAAPAPKKAAAPKKKTIKSLFKTTAKKAEE